MTTTSPRLGRVLLVIAGASIVSGAVTMALVGVLRDVLRVGCRFTATREVAGWSCADGAPYGLVSLQIGSVLWTFLVAGALAVSVRGGHGRRSLRVGSRVATATSGAVLVVFAAALVLQAVDLARSCGFSAIPPQTCSATDIPVGPLVWSVMPVWALLLIVGVAWASLLRPIPARPA